MEKFNFTQKKNAQRIVKIISTSFFNIKILPIIKVTDLQKGQQQHSAGWIHKGNKSRN